MGAMGLTGVVTSVELNLTAVETNQMIVDTDRFDDLESVMTEMRLRDSDYRYSVAWVDCMSVGTRMGRSVLTRARHARADDIARPRLDPPSPARLSIPLRAPSYALNTWSVRAFNELWYRSAPRRDIDAVVPLSTFFHPLDGVRNWNLLYGKRGFVQYQFCVPDKNSNT
jgi:decaprenylphospho-beta-D-ribofuranose 2-oxidase